jgi:competence protein CoiA
MLLAINPTNQQYLKAIPHTQAECPHRNKKVISKCGRIKIWHWAHEVTCIYHTEPESEWHLQWKEIALENQCQIEVRYGEHIADAVIEDKIIEFQHSSITSEEIISRSIFYNNVDWLFDYRDKSSKIEFYKRRYEEEKRIRIATHPQ